MKSKNIRKILVKMSSISNNRARQSDPWLAWLTFYKIVQMFRDIRDQESEESTELILNLCDNLNSNNTSFLSPIRPNISIQEPKFPLDQKTVPKDIKEIQSRPYQVCNCDEIGLYPNVSWLRVVFTYKFFTGKSIWKYQTGERSPFWCNVLIFTRADGQCFMTPAEFQISNN